MSAPNAGRQSPEPETQSGAQQQDPQGSGQVDSGSSNAAAQESSDKTKHKGLESNPTGVLEHASEQKTTKDGRGDV
ncbi:MAG: hypothetical protein M1819_003788 [Sarea resinae]|nr:MAG: hypothetical protein M1819_003788 [Sarea resinae]